MALTREDIREFVNVELGDPVVNIELVDAQIDRAADVALRLFNRYMCETQLRVAYEQGGIVDDPSEETGASGGSVVIDLGESARGVCEVKFLYPDSQRSYVRMSVFEIMYRMVFPRFPVSDWYFFRTYYEMFQQVRGTEPDWRYDAFSHTLYVDCSSGPYDIFYVVSVDLTLDTFDEGKRPYTQEFLDLTLARSKQTLARILGKFSNTIPGPGGPLMTDAMELRREGKEREKEIIEWLKRYSRLPNCIMMG